ncbi:MAG TPA: phosphotransferase [Bryobacteraceae bacterium]|nr:phosphotransferase [Bryobacteraceae bacterium]
MIPQEKSEAVTRALREAFGVSEFEDIRRVMKGLPMTLKYRIMVRGRPYLLRVIMRSDDATRHFACMRAAAEAGLAPKVWYTNTEDRVCITDFIEAVPLPVSEALVRAPRVLRRLHALPPFPEIPARINTSCTFLMNEGPALDDFVTKFQDANVLSQDQKEELFARYAEVSAVYPRDRADMVSSHNDLFKPDNILFDGDRVWLVDWEAAFLNDRYADLAVAANLVVTNDDEESRYLNKYFGQPADEYQRARFFLMRQIVHMFYAMAFLLLGSSGASVDWSESVPSFQEFKRRMWAGEVNLSDSAMKVIYGRVHWEMLLANTRAARFGESLAIVAQRARRLAETC